MKPLQRISFVCWSPDGSVSSRTAEAKLRFFIPLTLFANDLLSGRPRNEFFMSTTNNEMVLESKIVKVRV